MGNDRYAHAAKALRDGFGVDVLNDVLLGRSDRVYLYAEEGDRLHLFMKVISGTLAAIGLPDADQLVMDELLDRFDPDNLYAAVAGIEEYRAYVAEELTRPRVEMNVTFPIRTSSGRRWVNILMNHVRGRDDLLAVFLTDMTAVMSAEEDNYAKSHRDSLTGLFNKYTLDYHYGLRYKFPGFHALYLDLDDFKLVNDRLGHQVGDAFLCDFAAILKRHESGYDRFYRIGGDEFVGLFFGSGDRIRQVAATIVKETRELTVPGLDRIPSVSIGIVRATRCEDVIGKADQVMYRVKREGKNNYRYTLE